MTELTNFPVFSDAWGSTETALAEKEQRTHFLHQDRVMANPQDKSSVHDETSDKDDFPQAAIGASQQKKMTTTSSEHHYNSIPFKDGSFGGGSGNTNPNQAANVSPEKASPPRPYSPFHDMWQKYSGHFTPLSFQSLEEGKQMLQKRFASFLDDACTVSSCNNPEARNSPDPLQHCSDLQYHVVSPINETPSKPDFSRTPLTSATDKAGRSLQDTNPDNSFHQNSEKQKTSPSRCGMAGTVRGGVRDRRGSNVLTSKVTHENIEVNSEHEVKIIEPSPSSGTSVGTKTNKKAPLELLEVRSEDAIELERSISELTMRSSYGGGESLANIPDNRRMAYYAVGKNHRQSGRGGNRRCYFSGKLILGGAPFYAGSVQQGLRTLVVFCLPSAVNLPDRETLNGHLPARRHSRSSASIGTDSHGSGPIGILRETSRASKSVASRSLATMDKRNRSRGIRGLIQNNSMNNDGANSIASKSRVSSLDDLSLSIEGDLDPNWGLDRDFLLKVLPEADEKLLESMSKLFPEQFETLPIQVRDPSRWRLYVKFCFFSGLPIAEGEMHYKVLDELAEQVYGEEIALSHDVMEAVNGNISAEILQLPNLKVFRYLRKHYAQQCSKLEDRVFRRGAWIKVAPEV